MAKKLTPEEKRKAEANLKRREARAQRKAERTAIEAAAIGQESKTDVEVLGIAKMAQAARKSPAKVTLARENLTEAFELMGGVSALVKWGKHNPTEFYRIWSKLIPKEAVDESRAMPLEDLLGKLAQRAEQTVAEAAEAIGYEILDQAASRVSIEDAKAAFARTDDGVTIQ